MHKAGSRESDLNNRGSKPRKLNNQESGNGGRIK
jgi:hypothetical protein